MAIKITLHGVSSGVCSLSGKDAEGFLVEFHDEGEGQVFLSQKSFIALAKMKMAKGKKDQNGKPENKVPSVITIDPKPTGDTMVVTRSQSTGTGSSDGQTSQTKTVGTTVTK